MRRPQDPLLSRETILWLQTTCGNRAVQRLLARKAKERADEQKPKPRGCSPSEADPRGSWWRRLLEWFAKLTGRTTRTL